MNILIADGQAGSVLPLTWTLATEEVPAALADQTDGMYVFATMSWPALPDSEDVPAGSIGACVEALTEDGGAVESDQAICHVLNYEGNKATAAWVGSLDKAAWNAGSPAGGPSDNFNMGTKPLGAIINAEALGMDSYATAVVEEAVEEVEGEVEDSDFEEDL
jgi:hypothetical protein